MRSARGLKLDLPAMRTAAGLFLEFDIGSAFTREFLADCYRGNRGKIRAGRQQIPKTRLGDR